MHYCLTLLLQLSIPKGKNPTHYATILKCTFPSHFKIMEIFYEQSILQSMMSYNGYWPGGRNNMVVIICPHVTLVTAIHTYVHNRYPIC